MNLSLESLYSVGGSIKDEPSWIWKREIYLFRVTAAQSSAGAEGN
jgi:hypothetical protein